MNFSVFQNRLQIIKDLRKTLEVNFEKFLNNPFVQDCGGIPAEWLDIMISEHLTTLFMSVNDKSTLDFKDLVDYYLWEQGFGGVIGDNDMEYHLDNDRELYTYLLTN